MPAKRQHIVCFGRDSLLLDSRERMLKQAGYLTLSTTNAYLARECLIHCNVSILVLCHTLSINDVSTIVRFHHDMRSSASILSLQVRERCAFEYGDVYDAENGPVALLAAIRKLGNVYRWPSGKPALVM